MSESERRAGFPLRGGNRFVLLADGPSFYPAMLEAIRAARASVQLEMYLVTPGRVASRFAEALSDAARRGVTVEVLLDWTGSVRGSSSPVPGPAWNVTGSGSRSTTRSVSCRCAGRSRSRRVEGTLPVDPCD